MLVFHSAKDVEETVAPGSLGIQFLGTDAAGREGPAADKDKGFMTVRGFTPESDIGKRGRVAVGMILVRMCRTRDKTKWIDMAALGYNVATSSSFLSCVNLLPSYA